MKSVLEPLEGNKVKLSVEVDEAEFDRDIDLAFRKIAREVRLPGFRPGKAPRRILEARIGHESARQQALQDSIPQYLAKAVREHDVDLIATPSIAITGGAESGVVAFDAECEVRPTIVVPGYGGLRVELPPVEASADDLAGAVNAERAKHGSLADVDRPAAMGDFVIIDLGCERDGEAVSGLNVDDFSYELGKGWITDDFDSRLIGAAAGDELEFSATPKGTEQEANFTVSVTKVQEQHLPEVTDEWVGDHLGEFDTVEAWHAALRDRIGDVKLNQARQVFMDRTTERLAELVEEEAPAPMVESAMRERANQFARQMAAQGIDVNQWLAATGQEPQAFIENFRDQAERMVKVDLALRAIAAAEGLEVDDADVEREYQRIAMRAGQKVNQVRKAYEKNDAVTDLVSEIRKSKSLEWLLHRVEIVDPDGNPISNDLVLGHSAHDHDHDGHDHDGHDHDHEGHAHDHEGHAHDEDDA